MKASLLAVMGLLVSLVVWSCSAKKESAPPPHAFAEEPPPPAAEPFQRANLTELHIELDAAIRGLAVVNDEPFADMYFKHFGVNPTIDTEEENLSTFAVDVDTASYSMIRSYLQRGHLPREDAVRVEEVVNRFDYGYSTPEEDAFSVQVEAAPSPNRAGYHLLHIGLKGREIDNADRKPANLVFVIDVSGSMDMENRLGLVKRALALLVGQLDANDSVGIVVYGTTAHVILESTHASFPGKERILSAIDRLGPEGSTNAQAGLKLGYEMAARYFRDDQINRIVLCSDGVANNGITGADAIHETIQREAKRGITISAVGFGMGNYNDVLMERLADIGNGNYAYVDRLREARRIFVEELTGTLQVIAKDVKIQIELDKSQVARYRLLGFENRLLATDDFDNDAVDGGEIGAGHAVTALYEVRFRNGVATEGDFATLRIRYKAPEGEVSKELERAIPYSIVRGSYGAASAPTKLSVTAAAFAEKLRGSYWVRHVDYDSILDLWDQIPPSLSGQPDVQELHALILKAQILDHRGDKFETELPVSEMDFDRIPVLR